MKSTQKKLKAKHFRYISQEEIDNPMKYLDNFFSLETDLNMWLKDVEITLCVGAYPPLNNQPFIETGFNCKRMIEHLEIAYVIYHQCHLKHLPVSLTLFENRDTYVRYSLSDRIEPAEAIARFFLFQSLAEWYRTMDDLFMYLTFKDKPDYDLFGDKIIAIRAFWVDLTRALHHMFKHEGLAVNVPAYMIALQPEHME